jgi:hypothetical protein
MKLFLQILRRYLRVFSTLQQHPEKLKEWSDLWIIEAQNDGISSISSLKIQKLSVSPPKNAAMFQMFHGFFGIKDP